MKTKIIYAIALLFVTIIVKGQSGQGSTKSTTTDMSNLEPRVCNLFPICFQNTTGCAITICHDIKYVTAEEIVNGIPNMQGAYQICKTIGAYQSICITYEELSTLYPNHNIPSFYNVNSQTILEGVFQQTSVWTSNNTSTPDLITSPISVWQKDNSFGSMEENCNGKRIALNYFKGCPPRYTISVY